MKNANEVKELANIPPELIVEIFHHLCVEDAVRLSGTSKRYYQILNDPKHAFWQHYLKRDFPDATIQETSTEQPNSQYKATYLREYEAQLKETIKNLPAVLAFAIAVLVEKENSLTATSAGLSLSINNRVKSLNNIAEDFAAIGLDTTVPRLSSLKCTAIKAIRDDRIGQFTDNSLLGWAVDKDNQNIALSMIKMGIIEFRAFWGAIAKGQTAIVEAFINAHVDVNTVGSITRKTPLMCAICEKGHIGIVNALIKANADVNATNLYGTTPLMQAICAGRADIAKALIEAKANVNAVDMNGTSVLKWAVRFENIALETMFRENGAMIQPNATNALELRAYALPYQSNTPPSTSAAHNTISNNN